MSRFIPIIALLIRPIVRIVDRFVVTALFCLSGIRFANPLFFNTLPPWILVKGFRHVCDLDVIPHQRVSGRSKAKKVRISSSSTSHTVVQVYACTPHTYTSSFLPASAILLYLLIVARPFSEDWTTEPVNVHQEETEKFPLFPFWQRRAVRSINNHLCQISSNHGRFSQIHLDAVE